MGQVLKQYKKNSIKRWIQQHFYSLLDSFNCTIHQCWCAWVLSVTVCVCMCFVVRNYVSCQALVTCQHWLLVTLYFLWPCSLYGWQWLEKTFLISPGHVNCLCIWRPYAVSSVYGSLLHLPSSDSSLSGKKFVHQKHEDIEGVFDSSFTG